MFEITQEWAEGMIVEALIARGVPESEARHLADLTPLLDDARFEGFLDGGGGER
jgi:hypothetical protein